MAATTSFASLAVPAPDDSMDMSSPSHRVYDGDDIEIDFDDYPAPADTTDDDHMLEDASTQPAAATDEVMDEDVQLLDDPVEVPEELMHDEAVAAPEDDELIDYSDEEDEPDPPAHDLEIPNDAEALAVESAAAQEGVDANLQRSGEDAQIHLQLPPVADDAPSEVAEEAEPATNVSTAVAALAADPEEEENEGEKVAAADEQQDINHDEAHEMETRAELTEEEPLTVNTTVDAPADGPDTPTDTGLHPTTIQFGDLYIPLFKSRKQLDGLLKDDNLANVSLADLLRSCRQRLPLKTDEPITDDQDLVLTFDQLALTLVEDSRAASATSLDEVLQVYLELHHNDGVAEVVPLSLTLTTQLRFSSSLSMFKQATANGQGMSSFEFLHAPGDAGGDHDQFLHNGDEDWTGLAANEDPETTDDHVYDEGAFVEQDDTTAHSASGKAQQQFGDDEQYQDADQEYYFDDAAEGDYDAGEQGEAADALDDLAGPSGFSLYVIAEQHQSAGWPQESTAAAQDDVDAVNQDHHGSSASSGTLEGDKGTADNSIGEYYYDEDEIDWDEDLTVDPSEHTDTIQNEDSTVSTAYDLDDTKGGKDDQQFLASEDWSIELQEQSADAQYGEENQNNDGEGDHVEGFDDQTNNDIAAQQDYEDQGAGSGHYPGYMPEEEYDATHEGFAEGDFYEHGGEHTDFQGDATEESFDDTVLIHRPDEEGYEGEYLEGNYQEGDYQEGNTEDQHEDIFDDIGFDEDEAAQAQQSEADTTLEKVANSKDLSTGSPHGKRSFKEIEDHDGDFDLELPEVKKVRSS